MNKTKASDRYVAVSTPSGLCSGYSEPTFKVFDDRGEIELWVNNHLTHLCMMGYTIDLDEQTKKFDDKGRRTRWQLTHGEDDHVVSIHRVDPIEVELDHYQYPNYLVYDQIYESVEFLRDYVEIMCYVVNVALHSRGFSQDFMTFNKLTHELYEHVFFDLDDMHDGKQEYVTIDEDDTCLHLYKIQYNA